MPLNYVHQATAITVPKCVRRPVSYDQEYVRGVLTTIFLQDLDRQGASANLKASMVAGMQTFLKQTEQAEDKIKVIPGYVKQVSPQQKQSSKDQSYIGTKNLIIFTHEGRDPGKNEIIGTDWVDTTYTYTELGTMEYEVALANTISALAEASAEQQTQVWVRKFQREHESEDKTIGTKNHRWAIDISVEFDEDEFFATGGVSTVADAEPEYADPDYVEHDGTNDDPWVASADQGDAENSGDSGDQLHPAAEKLAGVILRESLLFEIEEEWVPWLISDYFATLSAEQREYISGMVDYLGASEKTDTTALEASEAARTIFPGQEWAEHVENAIATSYFDGTVLNFFAHLVADTLLAKEALDSSDNQA